MNKIDTILREAKGKILTREDFDSLATKYKFDKDILRRVMLNKGYIITIFRGVYYLKGYEEKKLNLIRYSAYELLSLGLEKKGNNIFLYFSGLEKTLLDMIYLKKEVDIKEYKFNKSLFLKESSKYNRIITKKTKELYDGNR